MSEFPPIPGPIYVTDEQQRLAAVAAIRAAGENTGEAQAFLEALGLIRRTENGWDAGKIGDSPVWDIAALTTHWR